MKLRLLVLLGAVGLGACRGCTTGIIGGGKENTDACAGVSCPSGETCRDGVCSASGSIDGSRTACNPSSLNGTCVEPMQCQNGVCYGSGAGLQLCGPGVNGYCADNAACSAGTCTPITSANACSASHKDGLCPGGQACVAGDCYIDDGTLFCSPQRPAGYCPDGGTCTAGACMDVQPTCSPSLPTGACGAWEQCVQGICVGPLPPDACSPSQPTGRCPADDVCVAGTCTPLNDGNACLPTRPNGLCPAGSACLGGDCIQLTDTNTCSASVQNGLCPGGALCRDGVCVQVACANGGSSCPPDQICSNFTCSPASCDPLHPTGVCVDPALVCTGGICLLPTCDADHLSGTCPLGQFCSNGTCQAATCSPTQPNGICAPGYRCFGGACTKSNCSTQSNPNAYCAPDVCDLALDVCTRPLCSDAVPDGRCVEPGKACVCDPQMMNCSCQVPPCSAQHPGGFCPPGELCATTAMGSTCVAVPCSLANDTGPCPDGSGRTCCNASVDSDPAQIQCTPAVYGKCVRKKCGPSPEDVDSSPLGVCPAGEACQQPAGSCQVVKCDLNHPNTPCTSANELCISGTSPSPYAACVASCTPTNLTGACQGNFVCIAGQCTPPCCLAGPGGCTGAVNLSTRDSDCDGASDAAEGARDIADDGASSPSGAPNPGDGVLDPASAVTGTLNPPSGSRDFDGDGIPDAFDSDSDGDRVPDRIEYLAAGTGDLDGDGFPAWLDVDSDGDYIADGIEARVNGADGTTPVSVPVNSDNDSIPDFLDTDSDNDGILDLCEGRSTCAAGPLLNFGPSGILVLQPTNSDASAPTGFLRDTKPDFRDTDSDGDGISDNIEARLWPWRTTGVVGNLIANAPANHDGSDLPDYRDFDSDNDGILDDAEDLNGNGVVDCQIYTAPSGTTGAVVDTRAPTGAAGCAPFADGASPQSYYNPLCASSSATQKCFFAETSRTHDDTDQDGESDGTDGVFLVCSGQNLKPINIYASQAADYLFALEQSYNTIRNLTRSGTTYGLTFNDTVFETGMNKTLTGSNATAGFVLQRTPAASVQSCCTGNLVQKAVQQEAVDRAAWQAASAAGQLSLASNGFTLILTRSLSSYDGFGTALSRYRVRTTVPMRTSLLRDRLIRVLDGSIGGLPAESLYTAGGTADTQGGPSANDFILYVQHLYRSDASVLVVASVTPVGDSNSERSNSYRPSCSTFAGNGTQATCEARDGCAYASVCMDRAAYCAALSVANCTAANTSDRCVWDSFNTVCKEAREYQIPVFYAQNATDGSAITQYGDDLAVACENFGQKTPKFDFMWTIDDSGSMSEEIAEVVKGAEFFADLVDASEADYRLASVATDEGLGGWEPAFGNASGIDVGNNGALPKRWSSGAPDAATTNDFTGKIQGRCTGVSAVDRTTNGPTATCDAAGYFAERLPPDTNGSGREFSMAMSMMLMYRAETSSPCSGHTGPVGCQGTGVCTWNATAGACFDNFCSGVSNATDCDGAEICEESKSRGQAYCSTLAGCTWVAASNDCVATRCASLGTLAACNAVRECRWNGNGNYCNDNLSFSCTTFDNNQTGCQDNAASMACNYLTTAGGQHPCVSSRCAGKNQTDCGATSGCSWRDQSGTTNDYCRDNDIDSTMCETKITSATCNATSGCGWVDVAYNNQEDCVSNLCRGLAVGPCVSTPGCFWRDPPGGTSSDNNTYCDDINSFMQSTPELVGCEWSSAYQACVPSMPQLCGSLTSQGACAGTGATGFANVCSWSGSVCTSTAANNRGCRGLTNATDCARRAPTCEWNATTSTCERELALPFELCDGNTQASCETRTGGACVWSGGVCSAKAKQASRVDPEVKRILVAVTDEEECYLKDKNLNGTCEWGEYNYGLMDYDPATLTGAIRAKRVEAYRRFLASRGITLFALTGDKANQSLASGPGNGGCNDNGNAADPNNVIIGIAESSGGAWGSICPADLQPTIESIVLQVLGQASPYRLSGPGQPISSTIKVAIEVCDVPSQYPTCAGGTHMEAVPRSRENGFDYDATFKTITLFGSARPKNDGDIVVSYRYWVDVTPASPGDCPCAQAGPSCACPGGLFCAINNFDFCNGATQPLCAARSNIPGNCFWNGSSCQHQCIGLGRAGCQANASCAWNEADNRCEIDSCSEGTTSAACDQKGGCAWNASLNRCIATGTCDVDPTCGGCPSGGVCDPNTGQCVCQAPCNGSCASGQTCDANDTSGGLCGTCKCPACPASCPQGQYCSNPGTCGQCVCDPSCGSCTSQGCNGPGGPPGCTGTFQCDSQAGPSCGICMPPTCNTDNDCPFGQQCVAGACVCDTTCGDPDGNGPLTACPQGSTCDSDPTSPTCGQCSCDGTCGVGKTCSTDGQCGPFAKCVNNACQCEQTYVCDTNPASPKCGTCRKPVNCVMCPEGQVCDLGVGECVIDPTCGGCPGGYVCNPTTGICQPGACPPVAATGSVSNPQTAPECQPQNLNCCFGSEGLSPFDGDLDGYLSCGPCGLTIQYCGGDPCDSNDNDPSVH